MRSLRPVPLTPLLLSLTMMASTARADTAAHFWSRGMGGNAIDGVVDVAVDAAGNTYVVGSFNNTADFGGSPLVSAGSTDAVLAKYDVNGVHQWSQRFGSTGTDVAAGVAVDAAGGVYITGSFTGTVNFGGVGLISPGGTDAFLAKYDANGTHVWSQRFGSTSNDAGACVDADTANNIVMGGTFVGTVNFGGANLVGAGSTDLVLAKYNSAGVHQWSQGFGGTGSETSNGVHFGPSGDVFATGAFQNGVDFGGGVLTSAGSNDIFVAKYNSAGAHQWSHRFGSTASDGGVDLHTDGLGNLALSGFYNLTVDFGGGPLPAVGQDGFVVLFNSSGVHQWSRHFGEGGNAVTVSPAGSVIVTGFFSGTANFGGSPVTSVGSSDIYLARFDVAGTHEWSVGLGSTSSETSLGIETDAWNNVTVIGQFSGASINFGGTTLISNGSADAFVAKFGPESAGPEIASIVDVGNDQGRSVAIRCIRSGFDSPTTLSPIVQYEAFRRNDPVPSALTLSVDNAHPRISSPESTPANWLFVSAVPAHGEDEYIVLAPTAADSTVVDGQYFSKFFIRAATSDPFVFFDSAVDSGYSLDNLSPSAPTNLVFASNQLTWTKSGAVDFDYFSIYGSALGTLDGSAVLIGNTTGTAFDVSTSAFVYYHVTATDFSGNEGKSASVGGATSVGDTPARHPLAINVYPNPFNPRTTIRFDVPARGWVRVSVYDARGSRVAKLVDREYEAGSHTVSWTGRDDRGVPSGSGVYFARLESNGATSTRKLVLLK